MSRIRLLMLGAVLAMVSLFGLLVAGCSKDDEKNPVAPSTSDNFTLTLVKATVTALNPEGVEIPLVGWVGLEGGKLELYYTADITTQMAGGYEKKLRFGERSSDAYQAMGVNETMVLNDRTTFTLPKAAGSAFIVDVEFHDHDAHEDYGGIITNHDDGAFHKEMKYEFAAGYAMPSGVDTDGTLQFTAHSEEGNSITLYYKLERTP